jgi:tetratricopeptide (TPR) repeat protein
MTGPSRYTAVALVVLATLAGLDRHNPARAEQLADGKDATGQARELFQLGRGYYERGLYAEAARQFRRAHQLSGRAELLFNLAQAARLAGDCQLARESYQAFIEQRPGSLEAHESAQHIRELAVQCPGPEPDSPPSTLPPLVPRAPASARAAPLAAGPVGIEAIPTPANQPRHGRSWAAVGLVGGGAVVGLLGAGTYLHNGGRQERWEREDGLLRAPGASAERGYAERQRTNDDLAASITGRDRVSAGLMIGGLVVAAAGVVLWLTR